MGTWYDKNAESIPDIGLREARKLQAYGSVTSMLQELSNYGLTQWIIGQHIMATETLPKIKDETEYDWIKRVKQDASEHSERAKELGTMYHDYCEKYMRGETVDPLPEHDKQFGHVVKWIDENVKEPIYIEKSFVDHHYRFGGRVDLVCKMMDDRIAIIDWKTQGTKNGKTNWYDTWCFQMGAYWSMVDKHMGESMEFGPDRCINLIISTTEEGLVKAKEWKQKEFLKGLEIFEHLAQLFVLRKNLTYGEKNE